MSATTKTKVVKAKGCNGWVLVPRLRIPITSEIVLGRILTVPFLLVLRLLSIVERDRS